MTTKENTNDEFVPDGDEFVHQPGYFSKEHAELVNYSVLN